MLTAAGLVPAAVSSWPRRSALPMFLAAPLRDMPFLTHSKVARKVTRPSGDRGALRKGGPAYMSFLTALIASFRNDEEGQGLAEYALILALIAIVAIIALIFLGSQVSTILSKVGASV